MPRAELYAEFCATFGRQDVSRVALDGLMKRKRWMTGRMGFEQGHRPGHKAFIGQERIDHNGYVEICVEEPNPHNKAGTRFASKHKRLWEAKHGPVPKGHCLKCLDGDKTNTDPANWELISRRILPRLNGGRWGKVAYGQADPAVRSGLLATARLKDAANQRRKGANT